MASTEARNAPPPPAPALSGSGAALASNKGEGSARTIARRIAGRGDSLAAPGRSLLRIGKVPADTSANATAIYARLDLDSVTLALEQNSRFLMVAMGRSNENDGLGAAICVCSHCGNRHSASALIDAMQQKPIEAVAQPAHEAETPPQEPPRPRRVRAGRNRKKLDS